MPILKKIKWFLAVLGVFLLILATNLIDKENFLRVEKSVENIYNERLLAKELLLEITIKFHQKELAYATNDSLYLRSRNDIVNSEITKLLLMFERSKATKKEVIILDQLKSTHAKLIEHEKVSDINNTLYTSECANIFSEINENIVALSIEQVKEGKNQKHLANEAIGMVKLFSNIEVYMLIFLALVLQFIILYKPKKKVNEN